MHHIHRSAALLLTGFAAALAGVPGAARADVTIAQQTSFDFAFIKAHGNSTEYTTTDKQRVDTDLHCEGLLKLVCGNAESGEIIRLDRDLTWDLEPKKKQYRETPFLTAAQRQAAEQEAQATIEKMKQCPAVQNQNPAPSAPDTSKCELSPPKLDVQQIGSHATFAGHDAQLTRVTLTQSCSNKQTGDVCDFVYALDTWLTQDQIAGVDETKAFRAAYLKKLGLTDSNSAVQKQMRQFLAPYASGMKQLATNTDALKGYPLKTALRIGYGGAHCAAAKGGTQGSGGNVVADAGEAAGNAAAGSAAGAAGSAAGTAAANAAGSGAAGSVVGSAASAFGSKLVSGLFQKKKAEAAASSPSSSAGTSESGFPPGVLQAAAITVETTSITAGGVPAPQFDIPAGWKLIEPQATKPEKEFSCPKGGT